MSERSSRSNRPFQLLCFSIFVIIFSDLNAKTQASSTLTNQPTTQAATTPGNQPSTQAATTLANQPTTQAATTLANQPTTQAETTLANQPSTQAVTTSGNQPTTQAATTPGNQPTTQAATTPGNQPTTQIATTLANQPTTQTATIPGNQPTTQTATTLANQPTTQTATTPGNQPTTQTATTLANQPTTQTATTLGNSPNTPTGTQLPLASTAPGLNYVDATVTLKDKEFKDNYKDLNDPETILLTQQICDTYKGILLNNTSAKVKECHALGYAKGSVVAKTALGLSSTVPPDQLPTVVSTAVATDLSNQNGLFKTNLNSSGTVGPVGADPGCPPCTLSNVGNNYTCSSSGATVTYQWYKTSNGTSSAVGTGPTYTFDAGNSTDQIGCSATVTTSSGTSCNETKCNNQVIQTPDPKPPLNVAAIIGGAVGGTVGVVVIIVIILAVVGGSGGGGGAAGAGSVAASTASVLHDAPPHDCSDSDEAEEKPKSPETPQNIDQHRANEINQYLAAHAMANRYNNYYGFAQGQPVIFGQQNWGAKVPTYAYFK